MTLKNRRRASTVAAGDVPDASGRCVVVAPDVATVLIAIAAAATATLQHRTPFIMRKLCGGQQLVGGKITLIRPLFNTSRLTYHMTPGLRGLLCTWHGDLGPGAA